MLVEREFMIVNRCNQVKTESKAFAAIPIAFAQYAEDFQPANDILDKNALTGELVVLGSLLLGQWMELGFLGRDAAVFMDVPNSQISRICQATNMG